VIVLDASVLIAHLAADQPQAELAANLLSTTESLVIHPLTLAECAVGPTKTGQLPVFQRIIRQLDLEIWQPDADHPYRLAALRAMSPLKLPECCVLDTARNLSATLATFDHLLAGTARSLGVTVTGLDTA
jgi:predicted nucleic acid-binding protein